MTSILARATSQSRRFGGKLKRDENGATAIEFALIAMPFFALLFGTLSVCLYFFWTFTSENAVWQEARNLRTGAVQTGATGTPYAAAYSGGTVNKQVLMDTFRQQVCNKTASAADCWNNSVVLVDSSAATFKAIKKPDCKSASNGLKSNSDALSAFDVGSQSSIVIVTLCYAWAFGGKLPFLKLPNQLANGSFLIQSSAVLETEPY